MQQTFVSSNTIQSLKKNVAQVYNKTNQEIYGVGVKKQRIEVSGNKILIFAEHIRVPALLTLSTNFKELTVSVDSALIVEFKLKFKQQVEQLLKLEVVTILKDYDPETEYACTIVYFEKPLPVT